MAHELLGIVKFILGFLPWILFLFLPTDGWEPLKQAVVICLLVSVVFGGNDLRKGFILSWASLLFFIFCVVSFYGFRWIWLAEHMGIIANTFLDGIIWLTILVGQPFALQYARADLPKEKWFDENLVRGCRWISVFWGILLLVPTGFSVLKLYYPHLLLERFYFYLSLGCILFGVGFTTFFKEAKRRQREFSKNKS